MASIKKITTKSGSTRYRVRWRVEGRLVEEWRRTRADADDLRNRMQREELDGAGIDPRAGARLVNDYFDAWLPARLVKGRTLTPATRIGYQRLWTRNVSDSIGRRQLRAVRPEMVRTWHGELVSRVGQDQAAKAYRLLRAVLATAEADELIRMNPCRIRGGGQEHTAERPMVPTEMVLDLADAIDPRYRALVLVAGFAGLRTGESLGLRRRDVDLMRSEVRVVRQAQEITGQGRIEIEPKSDAGRRILAVPRIVVDALESHLQQFTEAAPDSPVFTGPLGGPARRAGISAAWRAAKRTNGASDDLRMHDLRHHAATLAARTPGVTTKELMARIGHASPRAALIYQHATAERDRAVATFLDEQIAATDRRDRAPVVELREAQ
jgi:integrase